MPRIALPCLALCILPACSDAPLEPATFAEHCGLAGPARILELPAGQALASTQQIGDRLYHNVGIYDPSSDGSSFARFSEYHLWSTGPCGESPIQLGDGFTYVASNERWPDVVLGCKEGTGLFSIDPAGELPPNLIAPITDCISSFRFNLSDHGIVDVDAGPDDATGPLLLYPFPDDPRSEAAVPEVLHPAVSNTIRIKVWPAAVHAVTDTATLVRIDLADRELTDEQANVRAFEFSDDRNYLLWMDATRIGDEQASVVNLRNAATGTTASLGPAVLTPSFLSLRWSDQGLLIHQTDTVERIYFLPDLSFVDLPLNYHVSTMGPLTDDRWVIDNIFSRYTRTPSHGLLDLTDGTVADLFSAPGSIRAVDDDGLIILDTPVCCIDGAKPRDEGALWRVPLDGSDARKVADRATILMTRIQPSRIVTAVDIGSDRSGALIVVDPDTRDERRIDSDVFSTSLSPLDTPDLLIYSVLAPDRSGVWTAKLPPTD